LFNKTRSFSDCSFSGNHYGFLHQEGGSDFFLFFIKRAFIFGEGLASSAIKINNASTGVSCVSQCQM
jgi:hypothetical protein